MRIRTTKNRFTQSEAEAERKLIEDTLTSYRLERAIELVTKVMSELDIRYYPILGDFLSTDKEHYYDYIRKYFTHGKIRKEMKLMNRVEWVNYQTEKLRKERANA